MHAKPGPWAVMQPQTMIEPPPCFTVWLTWRGWRLSQSRIQHHDLPSEQKRLTLVSSDHTTRFQSSTVQSLCRYAKSKRALMFLAESLGFFCFSAAFRPASSSVRRTAHSLTFHPAHVRASGQPRPLRVVRSDRTHTESFVLSRKLDRTASSARGKLRKMFPA